MQTRLKNRSRNRFRRLFQTEQTEHPLVRPAARPGMSPPLRKIVRFFKQRSSSPLPRRLLTSPSECPPTFWCPIYGERQLLEGMIERPQACSAANLTDSRILGRVGSQRIELVQVQVQQKHVGPGRRVVEHDKASFRAPVHHHCFFMLYYYFTRHATPPHIHFPPPLLLTTSWAAYWPSAAPAPPPPWRGPVIEVGCFCSSTTQRLDD